MSLADSLRFAYVCPLAWEKLTSKAGGGPSTRHCDDCRQTVTELSGLSRTEADAFLATALSARDSVCVRIQRDAAGRAVHRSTVTAVALATVVALSGCVAQGGETGDTAGDTAENADTGDTGDFGSSTAGSHTQDRRAAGFSGKHRPVGTGLGSANGEAGDPDAADDAGAAPDGMTAAEEPSGLDALLSVLSSMVTPPEPPAPEDPPPEDPRYITMGVMARAPVPDK